jgi:uncharacterized protein (TIGR02186 family)
MTGVSLRRIFRWQALVSGLLVCGYFNAPVAAETIIAALSTHRVAIASNFTGAQLTVFGSIERDARSVSRPDPYDIVITIRGPRRMIVVREKTRVGPIWLNTSQRRFSDTAAFLASVSSRPLAEIADLQVRQRDKLGLASILLPSTLPFDLDPSEVRFRDALIRIEGQEQRFYTDDRGVTFLSSSLFRAPITLPATAANGNYDVDIVLMAGSVRLASYNTNFELVKTGIEQTLASAAATMPLLYGLATAALALIFGWLSALIFRRD